ncbi:MAG TPA: thioesterase family protein [Acidimicrobiales bacterium]|nr:thioesterase family protein [Acidimicrobiales bacterium]
MHQFDSDIASTPLGDGRWRTEISPRWNIGDKPNGGYVLACVLEAARSVALPAKPDPLTLTAHYLRPTSVGPADVEVQLLRTGRRHAHVEARLVQDTERVRVLAAFGDLEAAGAGADTPTLVRGGPPDLPPPEDCIGRDDTPGAPSLASMVESRFAPGTPWLSGQRSADTVVTGWIRFADGRDADVRALPLLADSFPPAIFALGPAGWVPTVELTVHVRARPAPGWLRCRFETRFLTGGYLEEDGEIWDAEGRLVAQSRQLAMLLTPERRAAAPRGAA